MRGFLKVRHITTPPEMTKKTIPFENI